MAVFKALQCDLLDDYHLLYMRISDCQLNPTTDRSSPGLAWGSVLLMTGVKLGLSTDLKMLGITEKEQCGGLCYIGMKRYNKANNHYLPSCKPNNPSNYSLDEGANHLYAWSIMKLLPIRI